MLALFWCSMVLQVKAGWDTGNQAVSYDQFPHDQLDPDSSICCNRTQTQHAAVRMYYLRPDPLKCGTGGWRLQLAGTTSIQITHETAWTLEDAQLKVSKLQEKRKNAPHIVCTAAVTAR